MLCECELDFEPDALRLPALQRLVLKEVRLSASSPTQWLEIFNSTGFPALVDLSLWSFWPFGRTQPSRHRTAAPRALAPQLKSLELSNFADWIVADDGSLWPLFTSLVELRLLDRSAGFDSGTDQLLSTCLRLLPNSLERFELVATNKSFIPPAHSLTVALRSRLSSVRTLRTLTLPASRTFHENGLQRFALESACKLLECEARERGVEVVFGEVTDGFIAED